MSNRLKVVWNQQQQQQATDDNDDDVVADVSSRVIGSVFSRLSKAVRTAAGEHSPVLGERITMIRNSYTSTEYGAVALFLCLLVLAVLVARYRVRRRQVFMEESFGFNKKKKKSS